MTTATPGTGQGDGLKYCCLQRGHTYSENTLHICATEEERNTLTQSLIYGESASGPDELEQWAKYAEELRETGNIEFEGDPGLEWFTAHISQPAASLPSTAQWINFSERHPRKGQHVTVEWCSPFEGEADVTWDGAESIDWKHECIPVKWRPLSASQEQLIAAQHPTDTAKPNQPGAVEALKAMHEAFGGRVSVTPGEQSRKENDARRLAEKALAAKPSDEGAGARNLSKPGGHYPDGIYGEGQPSDEEIAPSVQAAEGAGDERECHVKNSGLAWKVAEELFPVQEPSNPFAVKWAQHQRDHYRPVILAAINEAHAASAQAEREATRRRCGELHAKMVEELWHQEHGGGISMSGREEALMRANLGHTADFLRKLAALLQSGFGEGSK